MILKLKKKIYIYFNLGKLHFTTLNYALDYTLQPKLFKHILCTLNYHTYNTLYPGVTFAIMFNRMLLHMTSTCILLRWNKLKSLKHPTSKPIKTKPNFFHISLPLSRACSLFPKSRFFLNPKYLIWKLLLLYFAFNRFQATIYLYIWEVLSCWTKNDKLVDEEFVTDFVLHDENGVP